MLWRLAACSLMWSCLLASSVSATNYYISPSGSNSNNGLSTSAPFLTFSYALNAARAWCGDTLALIDGVYGDGTSTGKIYVNGVACTIGDELTITAVNQRKAKIVDSGAGEAVRINNSAHIIIDGLYATSTDNPSVTTDRGRPFDITSSHHVIIRNTVAKQPNRYANTPLYGATSSQDILMEDVEGYIFHRHCTSGVRSERVVVRRAYCNARGGMIPGGFNPGGIAIGTAAHVMVMYPCKDCILENSISDGTTTPSSLNGQDATFAGSVLTSNNKVLGSICYKCNAGNGMHVTSRTSTGTNYAPQNSLIRDVAFPDFHAGGAAIKCQDCINATIDHVHVLAGSPAGARGVWAFDSATGGTAADNSITITNTLIAGLSQQGFLITGYNTWSGDRIISTGNGTNYSPSLPSNWTNAQTASHNMGTCKVWVPEGAAGKGAGSGGSDIGANILYRYVDGVLTDVPLWDTRTGEFPHGDADLDGTNRVDGESIHDVHLRLNVNTNGCIFPTSYGGSSNPTNPLSHHILSGTGAIEGVVTIPPGLDAVAIFLLMRDSGFNVTTASSITSSCGGGESFTFGARSRTHATNALHDVEGWILESPTPGACTITVSIGTGVVNSWIMDVFEVPIGHTPKWAAMPPAGAVITNPSVTVSTNVNELIYAAASGSSTATVSPGSKQTFLKDVALGPVRMAVSSQIGNDGGVMDYVFGSPTYSALVALSLATDGSASSASTFRVTKYRIGGLYGNAANPEVTIGHLAAEDTPGKIAWGGYGRIRVEILVENGGSVPTGVALYCSTNGASYTRMQNVVLTGDIRLFGGGFSPIIPSDLSPTTQRFSGTFIPGYAKRDALTALILPAITQNTRTELDYQIAISPAADAGDTVTCEMRRDDGSTLGVHTVKPTIYVVDPSASMGY